MKTYAVVFFGSALLAIFGTPIVTRIARAWGLMDRPGPRKVHIAPVPRIGGLIIAFAALALILPAMALDNTIGTAFHKILPQVFALLATAIGMFALGIIDDVRGLRARIKLLTQVAAALTVCAFGVRIDSFDIPGWGMLDFGLLSWPITILWIVGITNAINLIDGLDGLAAGISAVTCGVIALTAMYTGQLVMAILMVALLGSLIGFLFFNFNPAKVFMGDGGTMFVGFMIGAASVMCTVKSATLVALAMPALALGLPIFDTLFSIVRRILERRSVFAPDGKHIHHQLLRKGLNQRRAVLLMYLVTLLTAGLGTLILFTREQTAVAVLVGAIAMLLLVFRIVGAVRLRESLTTLQHNLAHARQGKEEQRCFERAQLRLGEAKTFDDWWGTLCEMASEMEFVWLALSMVNGNGSGWTSVWRRPGPVPPLQDIVTISIPVGRRQEHLFQIEAGLKVNGSLEAAGHRAGLLGRLIDECDTAGSLDMLRDTVETRPAACQTRARVQDALPLAESEGPIAKTRPFVSGIPLPPEVDAPRELLSGPPSDSSAGPVSGRMQHRPQRDENSRTTGNQPGTTALMTQSMPLPAPLSVLGVSVTPYESYGQAVAHVESIIASGQKCFCIAINPEKVHRAISDPGLMAALRQADMGICDGIGIALAARVLYRQRLKRCTGCDLFFHLIERASEKGWRVFVLGASPESNEQACSTLSERYPGLQIVGRRDGYFDDSSQVVRQVNDSRADLLFVALGSPKQELWIARHRRELNPPFCMGIGGTLDVVSGQAKRALAVFRKTGTEFLFRLMTDPRRWRRQLALPLFAVEVLKQRLATRLSLH